LQIQQGGGIFGMMKGMFFRGIVIYFVMQMFR
jgi:hypothetical protein